MRRQQRQQIALKALRLREEALGSASGEDRFVQLSDITKAALEAGDARKLERLPEKAAA
jgi:hypothetical protein